MEIAYDKTPVHSNAFSTYERMIDMLRLQIAKLQEEWEELSSDLRELQEMFKEYNDHMHTFKRKHANCICKRDSDREAERSANATKESKELERRREESVMTYEGITAMDSAKAPVLPFIYSGFTLLDFAACFITINVMWLILEEMF